MTDHPDVRGEGERVIARILQRVAELPGRTSPDDWPEAMLATHAELAHILADELPIDCRVDVSVRLRGLANQWRSQADKLLADDEPTDLHICAAEIERILWSARMSPESELSTLRARVEELQAFKTRHENGLDLMAQGKVIADLQAKLSAAEGEAGDFRNKLVVEILAREQAEARIARVKALVGEWRGRRSTWAFAVEGLLDQLAAALSTPPADGEREFKLPPCNHGFPRPGCDDCDRFSAAIGRPTDQQEGEGLIEDHEFVACDLGPGCPFSAARRNGCHHNLQPHGLPCAQPASRHRGTKEGR